MILSGQKGFLLCNQEKDVCEYSARPDSQFHRNTFISGRLSLCKSIVISSIHIMFHAIHIEFVHQHLATSVMRARHLKTSLSTQVSIDTKPRTVLLTIHEIENRCFHMEDVGQTSQIDSIRGYLIRCQSHHHTDTTNDMKLLFFITFVHTSQH